VPPKRGLKTGWTIAERLYRRGVSIDRVYVAGVWDTPREARLELIDLLWSFPAESSWWRKIYLVQLEQGRVIARLYVLPPLESRTKVARLQERPASVLFLGGSGGSQKPWL
jgi:hypothetical protein